MARRTQSGEQYTPAEIAQARLDLQDNWRNDAGLLVGSISMLRTWVDMNPGAPSEQREETARLILKYVHLADVLNLDLDPMAYAETH